MEVSSNFLSWRQDRRKWWDGNSEYFLTEMCPKWKISNTWPNDNCNKNIPKVLTVPCSIQNTKKGLVQIFILSVVQGWVRWPHLARWLDHVFKIPSSAFHMVIVNTADRRTKGTKCGQATNHKPPCKSYVLSYGYIFCWEKWDMAPWAARKHLLEDFLTEWMN